MTVDLDSGSGLMDRLGALKFLCDTVNGDVGPEGSAGAWPKELADVLDLYDGSTLAVRSSIDDLVTALVNARGSALEFLTQVRLAAEETLIAMVDADTPLPELSVEDALAVLIEQMLDAGETVDASEPTISHTIHGERIGTITGATQQNAVVVTSNGHGLADGDRISIFDVVGMTEINGRVFTVDSATTNTFELLGEDGTGHTAYSSGGLWKANHGDGLLVTSLRDGRGRTMENVLAETIVATCTLATTAGRERFTFEGEAAASDKLAHDWPAGSGANENVSSVDAASGSPNLLANSDFEDFTTTNTPDDWDIDTGSAGSDVLEEGATVYKGSKCLELDGDGATLSALSQEIANLASRTPYAFCLWTHVDVSPAAGVLVIDLYDGSEVISDDEGNANSVSIDLTAEPAAAWVAHHGVFRLPEPVPETVQLRIRLSTAVSSGSSVFIDHLAFAAMSQLYAGTGPYALQFSGAKDFALGDQFKLAIENAREGAVQEMFDVFFGTGDDGELLPSVTGGGETISDGVIA